MRSGVTGSTRLRIVRRSRFRRLGDIRRDPSRLVFGEQLGRRAPGRVRFHNRRSSTPGRWRHDAPMTVSGALLAFRGRGAWRHPFISFQATTRAKARTINTDATINTRQYCVPSTFRSDLLKRAKHSGHLYVSKPLAVPNLVPHCGHVTRGASGMRRKINWQPPINNDRQARKNSN